MAPALLLLVLKKNPNHFEDPKAFDNTPTRRKYRERSVQIATAFLCILTNKKIICPQLIALLH
jgi:hypothetical protein